MIRTKDDVEKLKDEADRIRDFAEGLSYLLVTDFQEITVEHIIEESNLLFTQLCKVAGHFSFILEKQP